MGLADVMKWPWNAAIVIWALGFWWTKLLLTNPSRWKEWLAAAVWPITLPLLVIFSRKEDPTDGHR